MDTLWAGWRSAYVADTEAGEEGCLFCRLPDRPDEEVFILERADHCFSVLNVFPYTTGHLMVAPYRHLAMPGELSPQESAELWRLVVGAQQACLQALRPQGFNLGANLGRQAGAGIPDHFHFHVVPRWAGDTNFMTSLAMVRVMPESLPDTWAKLRRAVQFANDGDPERGC
ncbi:MAG: HIT domain-containing protein [Actinomycetota bacterium]|nr:HIT domain-containing protein [Actinomycetota bacterium]